MSSDQKEICLYCKWWKAKPHIPGDRIDRSTPGLCSVNPPVAIQCGDSSGGFYGGTMLPASYGGDFCSKFEGHPDDHESSTFEHISAPAGRVIKKLSDQCGAPDEEAI